MKFGLGLSLLFFATSALAAPGAEVDVTLFPAGDFTGKTSKVEGFAVKKGEEVSAKDVKVDLRTLKTGNNSRDTHTQRYLNTKAHPFALLHRAKGRKGKGSAEIQIMGKRKVVNGTYEIKGKELVARFPIKFSQFGIKDVSFAGVGVEDDGKITITLPLREGK
jgi:polyisoprenoid-binding protein YceI